VEAKVYQATFTDDSCDESEEDLIPIVGTGPAARKASASKAAAAAAKTAGAKYSRKTYAPATLPDGAVVAKVVAAQDQWLGKAEYQELGPAGVYRKCL